MTSIINTITRMRPKLALLCALMLACCCLAAPAQAEYVTNDALHLGIISVATNRVNPLTPVEREFMSVTNLMYEGLMYIDDEYKPQYCLAERYSYTNSGKTWFFYLRDGVTFHDGTPLTAHDVVATVQEILRLAKDDSSTNKGRYSTLQYFIKSIEASDNKTVVITTNRNNYGFLYAMTFPILKADEVQADNPVGTGPYYLDMYDFSSYLLLSCYTGWWQNLPDYRQVLVSLYSTNRELISGYEYSNVDAILTRAITAAQYRTGVTSYNIDYRTTQLETLMMNNGSYELKDVRVRQAIRYMLDLDDIVNNVYYGMVTRTDTPLIPGTWTYWSENDAQQFNKQRAMELLDEAGDAFNLDAVRAGQLTPMFFGSAVTNFGVEPFLERFLQYTPPPLPRESDQGMVEPDDERFSGFIFKIQANMNPAHRDRLAFLRIVSGEFRKGMTVWHSGSGKEIQVKQPQQFMADEREGIETAYPGDIIGLFDPGIYHLGDTLCVGRKIRFEKIPVFAPEHFARVRPLDSMKRKQFVKGIMQLSEEGAIQTFKRPGIGFEEIIVGVVGVLQFEVLEHRLKTEYNAEIRRQQLPYRFVRWITKSPKAIEDLKLSSTSSLAKDARDRDVILFENEWSIRWALEILDGLELAETASRLG